MIIYRDGRHSSQHVRRYNGPQVSHVATNITGVECGIVGRKDIVMCRRSELSETSLERFETMSITHLSYDLHTFVLLFSHGTYDCYLETMSQTPLSTRRQSQKMIPPCSVLTIYFSAAMNSTLHYRVVVIFSSKLLTSTTRWRQNGYSFYFVAKLLYGLQTIRLY